MNQPRQQQFQGFCKTYQYTCSFEFGMRVILLLPTCWYISNACFIMQCSSNPLRILNILVQHQQILQCI